MGGSAVFYEVEYYTTAPDALFDQEDWWYGCQVKFTDQASIEAALGAYNGSYGANGWLPAPVTAECSLCDATCCN